MKLGLHVNQLDRAAWPVNVSPKLIRVISNFHWSKIETSPGAYDWTVPDAIFSKVPTGVEVIASLDGFPAFYTKVGSPFTLIDYTKLSAFTQALLTRYPQISYAEGPNEPGQIGMSVSETIAMQKAVFIGAWNFRPKVKVISAPDVLNDKGFALIEGLLATGAIDLIGCHFYSSDLSLEELTGNLWRLRDLLKRKGGQHKDKPIWVTEWGFNIPPDGVMRFPDMPQSMQTGLLRTHAAALSVYADAAVFMAYDDPDYGFQGNSQTELEFNNLVRKYR